MKKRKFILFVILFLVILIVTIEAYLFNDFIERLNGVSAFEPPSADVIICLTGGSRRIPEAFRLLDTGKAKKLFLSGVNKEVSLDDILQIITMDIPEDMLANIIIDKSSMNTFDNAKQSLIFVENEGYNSIILLTSHYHMVRALYIFDKIFPPDIIIYPYPIRAPEVSLNEWWKDIHSRKIIISEFIKYSWYKAKFLVFGF